MYYCCVESLWLNFEFQLSTSCMVDFQLSASWGIYTPPRMYILGNMNIVQDDSELQGIMAIKIP